MKRNGNEIGGNELLLDEMITQENTRKGYISKQDQMKIRLMNLTFLAAAADEEKKLQKERRERREAARSPPRK